MNQPSTAKSSLAGVPEKKNSDVVVTHINQTVLFKPQNRRVSEWLRGHYRLSTGSANGDTEIRVHPSRCKRIIEELKVAGFVVSAEKE
jgi:hypothetical protein